MIPPKPQSISHEKDEEGGYEGTSGLSPNKQRIKMIFDEESGSKLTPIPTRKEIEEREREWAAGGSINPGVGTSHRSSKILIEDSGVKPLSSENRYSLPKDEEDSGNKEPRIPMPE